MKRVLLILLGAVLVTGLASAAITNSKHDLSSTSTASVKGDETELCKYCHVPHQVNGQNLQQPLWNHKLATAGTTYTLYTSATMDTTQTSPTGAAIGSATMTQLCLGCHDGTVGLGEMYNATSTITDVAGRTTAGKLSGGAAFIGTDLRNDHPVSLDYATYAGTTAEFNNPSGGVIGGMQLYGGSETQLECATCHDPHDNATGSGKFLAVTNAASAMCKACHAK